MTDHMKSFTDRIQDAIQKAEDGGLGKEEMAVRLHEFASFLGARVTVETYAGHLIECDGVGFYCDAVSTAHFGTLEEARADIDAEINLFAALEGRIEA